MTELSVLIVNYNSWRLCVDAVHSLRASPPTRADGSPMTFEVVVVDNCSPTRDPEAETELEALIGETGGAVIRHDENGGYSKGMNLAFRHARGAWILISNPDVKFQPGCIDRLLRATERDASIGAAAPVGFWDEAMHGRLPPNILPTLRDLIGTTLTAVSSIAMRRYSRKRTRAALGVWRAESDIDLAMLSGCCFLMRRTVIDRIGLFDERYPLYYEDTDLSVRIRRAGLRIVQVHDAHLVHLYNRSGQTAHDESIRRYWDSRRKYYRKWYGRLGQLVYDASQRFLATRWARRRNEKRPRHIQDLGEGHGKPVIRLPSPCDDFLIEISLDPRFYLAGGVFGRGAEWVPSDSLFKGFGPTSYFFRVVDLTDPRLPEIETFCYTLRYPPVFEVNPPATERRATGPAKAAALSGGIGDERS